MAEQNLENPPEHLSLQERRLIPLVSGAVLTFGVVSVLASGDSGLEGATSLYGAAFALFGILLLLRGSIRPYRIDTDQEGIHISEGLRYILTRSPETISWEDAGGAELRIRRTRGSNGGSGSFRLQAVLHRRAGAEGRRRIVLRGSYRTGSMFSGAGDLVDLLNEQIRRMRAAKGLTGPEDNTF